jgi:hypothetical protein
MAVIARCIDVITEEVRPEQFFGNPCAKPTVNVSWPAKNSSDRRQPLNAKLFTANSERRELAAHSVAEERHFYVPLLQDDPGR